MIAKLFRDGTVSAGTESLRNRCCKVGFFLDWTMMNKAAGKPTTTPATGFDHEETAEPPSFREDVGCCLPTGASKMRG